eukprot:1947956-Amphidinium_carterae.1
MGRAVAIGLVVHSASVSALPYLQGGTEHQSSFSYKRTTQRRLAILGRQVSRPTFLRRWRDGEREGGSCAHVQSGEWQAIDVWSVGCIYAELIGMLEGTKTEDRGRALSQALVDLQNCQVIQPRIVHNSWGT